MFFVNFFSSPISPYPEYPLSFDSVPQAKKKGKVTKLLSESVLRKEMENLAGLKKINMKRLEAVRVQLNLRELQTYRDNQLKQIKESSTHG